MVSRHIPEKIKKKIYQEANMECPNCAERDVSTFEIHHIQQFSEVQEHAEENLILLCSNCHSKATAGELTEADVLRLKIKLMRGIKPSSGSNGGANVINLNDVRNNGVIANNINVKTTTKKIQLTPASGTIAAVANHRNYVKYLIDRYHEFKVADVGKGNMKYPVFYGAIKKEFGAKWDLIPMTKFDELIAFIQKRIDKTKLGKNNKAKGIKRYSTYSEYLAKHCS